MTRLSLFDEGAAFRARHLGVNDSDQAHMLSVLGAASRQALIDAVMPASIARQRPMQLPPAASEAQALAELKALAGRNRVLKSFIGQGYYGTHTPGVILRNVLENPAWYTAYTPYQAEISQGRLEALLNFQTMVADLTGMDLANASMLDEATSAAEAMTLANRSVKSKSLRCLVAPGLHPQVLQVLQTRAEPLGLILVEARSGDEFRRLLSEGDYFAALVQAPATDGLLMDLRGVADEVHRHDAAFIMGTDLLALTLIKSPGEWGADIAYGSSQRFGMPMGAGGPHAAFLACKDAFKRSLPGRLVGVSVDAHGQQAYRLALQTREQHIRREKATSNICTAQVLPAVVASMYAVYHGPEGLKRMAQRVAKLTAILAIGLRDLGVRLHHGSAFDTLSIDSGPGTHVLAKRAEAADMLLRPYGVGGQNRIGISLDETSTPEDVQALWKLFARMGQALPDFDKLAAEDDSLIPTDWQRESTYLSHPVFNQHRSETQMLRYLRRLSDKDLALDRSMIPLGSCTMKLNATAEMIPITWPEFANLHPFAPQECLEGLNAMSEQLVQWLCQATGYAGISLQPNAGSQGEYAGLLAIQAWQKARGQGQRQVCLIPESAHGTNPASAQMVGMQVVPVKCDALGNVDMAHLQAQCQAHSDRLAAIMITYPSTYGVFDPHVKDICATVHEHGGRVYIDGANMNALVGLAAPGEFGGDVSHLNLHKTFCIPHGGGGPGVGPVCVVEDLVPFLPGAPGATPSEQVAEAPAVGPVSAAPLGNAAVLPISWMYIRMMGAEGLREATEVAILNANYVAARLADHYPVRFNSQRSELRGGGVAHECILDLRPLKDSSGVTAEDVAKRLIDYGFHAPTLSFPVAGTLMVEPTESESLEELDRFCDAMIAIRAEIARVESGDWPREDNPLKNAPHTASSVSADQWAHAYPREVAAYPLASLRQHKYWSPVARVDNVWGDRNLFCSCPPMEAAS